MQVARRPPARVEPIPTRIRVHADGHKDAYAFDQERGAWLLVLCDRHGTNVLACRGTPPLREADATFDGTGVIYNYPGLVKSEPRRNYVDAEWREVTPRLALAARPARR